MHANLVARPSPFVRFIGLPCGRPLKTGPVYYAMRAYTETFYRGRREGSRLTAGRVVPLVLGLVEPKSVIDVGCGTGAWLSVFQEHGVHDIFGVDGPYMRKQWLEISPDRFLAFDLRNPLRLERTYDLAIALEVAEHLPSACADTLVDSLTGLSPVVLFSAAIPFQGGVQHLNEQWPEYWAALFERRAYVPIDALRRELWRDNDVEWWYAQNILLFARREFVETHPLLAREHGRSHRAQLSLVHPRAYLDKIEAYRQAYELGNVSVKRAAWIALSVVAKALKRRLRPPADEGTQETVVSPSASAFRAHCVHQKQGSDSSSARA